MDSFGTGMLKTVSVPASVEESSCGGGCSVGGASSPTATAPAAAPSAAPTGTATSLRSTLKVRAPTTTVSPSFKLTCFSIRSPLTRVPFVLPRSRTLSPNSSAVKTQWCRLTSSLLGRRWQSCSRPIRNLPRGSATTWLFCLPPITFNSA